MKFKQLYENGLTRIVNPAVSVSDLSEKTVSTEIGEYVFTEEIVINIYKILSNIKLNQGSHVGIWINGYFGSGKSHFLKYASYCLAGKKDYRNMAFQRIIEATEEFNKKATGMSKLDDEGVTISNLRALQDWYVNKAQVEMVMLDLGDWYDKNADANTTFTKIFWNQFNAQRGYNPFNLALAQYLEKALDEEGKFEEFKAYVASKGYDWSRNISKFGGGKLDKALEMAKAVAPDLAYDVIRNRISKNDVDISVEAFAHELKNYLDKKDHNYRLLFFVDEVSQFIGDNPHLLLQLQSLVKRLNEVCESRVWVACTAQQTLEDVVTKVGGSTTNPEDEIGKILGRFEVRAPLSGTKPEYITRKRILEKKPEVELELANMFTKNKTKLDAQFVLPATFPTYTNQEDFVGYYPFVPYQFPLIMKVLDSFQNMGYVDTQVKGNERPLIRITYMIAQKTAENEAGEFIPFDSFYKAFEGSMKHLGQRARENALLALETINDDEQRAFYQRVVDVLFMICNLSEVDKQLFSATIDNIATLLMTKIDAAKVTIKNDVAKALEFLMDKSVIRLIRTESGSEIYDFYTEEESKVAQLIKNTQVDSNTYSEEIYKIIYNHFGFSAASNKENYCTRSFNVGGNVDGRACLSNNADVVVDFLTSASTDTPEQFAFTNQPNHLVFFLYPQIKENDELRRNFLDYCRVQRFAQEPAISEERQRTKRLFVERAKDIYAKEILPKFQQILDTCPVISGQNILTASELGTAKKAERYKTALARHFDGLYTFAKLVNGNDVPKNQNELSAKIMRTVDNTLIALPLSEAEKKIKDYLDRAPHDVTVADLVRQFAKVPYGWSDIASIYVANELVRRHLYSFNYNNKPNASREDVSAHIVREQAKFTIEQAQAIPQEIINNFIDAWKQIFNVMTVSGSNDETELYRSCKETEQSALNKLLKHYRELDHQIFGLPFAPVIVEAITLLDTWHNISDHKKFFETITAAKDEAAQLFDRCKNVNTFVNDQFDNYKKVRDFLETNKDNFDFLAADQQEAIDGLKAIKLDEEPWKNLSSYLRIMRALNIKLQECKAMLVDVIRKNYIKAFEELDEYAASVQVTPDKYANKNVTITQKTNSDNFYVLQANADTTVFMQEQMAKIDAAKPKQTGPKRKVIKIKFQTEKPITSLMDIEDYLAGIRKQILDQMDNESEIVIR